LKDGRWVVDDYFEEAAKIEAAEKGAKPGDIVIEPQQDFSHTISTDTYGKGQKESRTGIYKPGGPTTFFGSDAVGPFRGEMSSTKKAMLARENLTEENWMHAAALSVLEANEELRRSRAEKVVPGAGLDEVQVPLQHTGSTVTHYVPSTTQIGGVAVPVPIGEQGEGGGEIDTKTLEETNAASSKPLGVYEVHTGIIHCMCILLLLSLQGTDHANRPDSHAANQGAVDSSANEREACYWWAVVCRVCSLGRRTDRLYDEG
jgi:hypothetical protein